MIRPYYKIISESDRPFPERKSDRNPFTDSPVLVPVIRREPVERRHPPALPRIYEEGKIFIKQVPVKSKNKDSSKRLRLAKAKAKARIRKIKLLAI
jgi:hypothetical protein